MPNVFGDDLPFVVSYPRCGRHWIVACIELYFRRPCACRINNFLTISERAQPKFFYHHHDETVTSKKLADKVLYLYRHPVDAIYSFYRVDPKRKSYADLNDWVAYRSAQYRKHLLKYLTTSAVLIRYDNLLNNFTVEFSKVCKFFGVEPNEERVEEVGLAVTKERMVGQTPWLCNILDVKIEQKNKFYSQFESAINQIVLPDVQNFFDE